MATDSLDLYLNEHLAGATAGLDLARKLASETCDTPLGMVMSELASDIEDDRDLLKQLMAHLGIEEHSTKRAAGWATEKLTRIRFGAAEKTNEDLGRLLEMEMLWMGVNGKLSLWECLQAASSVDERLQVLDTETLIKRADDQLARLEDARQEIAVTALTG